jgi:hypothetical protein
MIEDFYLKLQDEGIFEDSLTLYLLESSNRDLIARGGLSNIQTSKNEIFIISRGYNEQIKLGATFDAIFASKNPNKGCRTKAIINELQIYGEKKDIVKHDILILTQKSSYNTILKRYNILLNN